MKCTKSVTVVVFVIDDMITQEKMQICHFQLIIRMIKLIIIKCDQINNQKMKLNFTHSMNLGLIIVNILTKK